MTDFVDDRSESQRRFAANTIESEGFIYTHQTRLDGVHTEYFFNPEDLRTGSIIRMKDNQTVVLREINPE
jgi:hypothetical protein